MRRRLVCLDFEVDKLTNSIELVETGDVFATDVLPVSKADLKLITKKNGWGFNWKYESKQPGREVYKLTIVNDLVIQGLICLEVMEDHIHMHLIENAPFNIGKEKKYAGVPGNLVAYVCKKSFEKGFEGNLAFISKTRLIEHYSKTLGAIYVGNQKMIIETKAALILTNKYFKQ